MRQGYGGETTGDVWMSELSVVCGLLVVMCATAGAKEASEQDHGARLQEVQKAFEITVRDRANPLDPVLAVAATFR
jgi:hypothetical protein